MKKFFIALSVAAIAAVIVLSLTPAFHKWNAKRVNDIKQEYAVQDADVRVSTYEWFYDQYGQIQATADKARLLNGDDRTGTEMVLYGMVQEYNSKARMQETKAMWMPRDIPYQLNLKDFIKEEDK